MRTDLELMRRTSNSGRCTFSTGADPPVMMLSLGCSPHHVGRHCEEVCSILPPQVLPVKLLVCCSSGHVELCRAAAIIDSWLRQTGENGLVSKRHKQESRRDAIRSSETHGLCHLSRAACNVVFLFFCWSCGLVHLNRAYHRRVHRMDTKLFSIILQQLVQALVPTASGPNSHSRLATESDTSQSSSARDHQPCPSHRHRFRTARTRVSVANCRRRVLV